MAKDCLAAPGTEGVAAASNKSKTCYKCQQEGHVRLHFVGGSITNVFFS